MAKSKRGRLGRSTSGDFDDVALKHAWDWFSLHAAQRMQSLNLFLVSVAFLLAGYGVAYQSANFMVASFLSIAGIIVAVCFALLDLRNRQLIRAGEAALERLQDQLADLVSMPEIRMLASVEKPDLWGGTYTRMIRGIALALLGLFLVALIVALASLFNVLPDATVPVPSPSPSLPAE